MLTIGRLSFKVRRGWAVRLIDYRAYKAGWIIRVGPLVVDWL